MLILHERTKLVLQISKAKISNGYPIYIPDNKDVPSESLRKGDWKALKLLTAA